MLLWRHLRGRRGGARSGALALVLGFVFETGGKTVCFEDVRVRQAAKDSPGWARQLQKRVLALSHLGPRPRLETGDDGVEPQSFRECAVPGASPPEVRAQWVCGEVWPPEVPKLLVGFMGPSRMIRTLYLSSAGGLGVGMGRVAAWTDAAAGGRGRSPVESLLGALWEVAWDEPLAHVPALHLREKSVTVALGSWLGLWPRGGVRRRMGLEGD